MTPYIEMDTLTPLHVQERPAELHASIGEAMRSVTPGFLRPVEPNPDEQSLQKMLQAGCFPRFTRTQRMAGTVLCFAAGALCTICSAPAVRGVLLGHPTKFAVLYTLGNVVSLGGTCCLAGPGPLLRSFTRRHVTIASSAYVISMLLTLIEVFTPGLPGRPALVVILVACQWLALVWYFLSYVPFGRRVVISAVCRWGWSSISEY